LCSRKAGIISSGSSTPIWCNPREPLGVFERGGKVSGIAVEGYEREQHVAILRVPCQAVLEHGDCLFSAASSAGLVFRFRLGGGLYRTLEVMQRNFWKAIKADGNDRCSDTD
jgi:hypothetical protein